MPDSKEKLDSMHGSSAGPDKVQSGPKLSGNKDVKKGAESVLEATDSAEDGGEAMGNVSEEASENKSGPSQGGSTKSMTADEIEQLRAKLLASAPPEEMMVKQIAKSLRKQEKELEHEYHKLASNPSKNPSRYVEVVSNLRQISMYFESLLSATYEYVKHLWLKIVHGI